MSERILYVLMKELCSEMDIKIERIDNGSVLRLSKEGKIRYIAGSRLDLNPEAAGKIASDKHATYEVLNSQNVSAVEHDVIINPVLKSLDVADEGIWGGVASIFQKHGKVVVKPNDGTEGKDVSLCKTMKETEIAIQKLFIKRLDVCICPYYDIQTEYRTFYLNGKVYLIYGKTKPFVKGDGKSSVGELVQGLNLQMNRIVVRENLKALDLSYIPKDGEIVNVSWKHNLSGGAKPFILEKGDLYSRIENLAISAGKTLNMNFASIDIIHTTDDNLYVLEINSGICTRRFIESVDNGREIVKNVCRDALNLMFQ